MRIVRVQFAPWDKIYNFIPNNLELAEGDYVIVKTNLGKELGQIISFDKISEDELSKMNKSDDSINENELATNENKISNSVNDLKPVIRKAMPMDFEKRSSQEEKGKALLYCQKMIIKHELPMKLVDVHFSYDGSRITFAFIADGRVDFRELVKDLTKHFHRTIRLYQVGIRDEAKFMGDYGPCGQDLCCRRFIKDMASITSEMAENQQVVHRGSERISGICGRLMCCLAYEDKGYKELALKLPAMGREIKINGKKGIVVGQHILKQTIEVEFPSENKDEPVVVEVEWKKYK